MVLLLAGVGHLERAGRLDRVHTVLLKIATPCERIVSLPVVGYQKASQLLRGVQDLQQRLANSELQLLQREADLQQLEALQLENDKLRSLLNLAERDRVAKYQAAQVLAVNADEFDGKITLNLGKKSGIHEGSMVVTADGILGQIVTVKEDFCRALPIIHEKSAVPAVIGRNGLEVVVLGTGISDELRVTGLTETADIVRGDLILTSGRGGKFLPGYLIGHVTKIVSNNSEKFLQVTAVPAVRFDAEIGQVLICKSN